MFILAPTVTSTIPNISSPSSDANTLMDVPLIPDDATTIQTAAAITPTNSDAVASANNFDQAKTAIATTPSVSKERKRRIIIDDDDESPTFNPLSRSSKKARGKNRNRKGLLNQKQRKMQLLSPPPTDKPNNESAIFTSPEGIVSAQAHYSYNSVFISSQ